MISFKIDLDIAASRIIEKLELNDLNISKEIEAGITRAIKELSENDNLERLICEATKDQLRNIVHEAVTNWELKRKLKAAIHYKIEQKIDEYADNLLKTINL